MTREYNISSLETAAALELIERKRMALRIFRPQPHQEPIFQTPRAKYSVIQGGNRSSAAGTEVAIYRDSELVPELIENIKPGDQIQGFLQGKKRNVLLPTEVLTKEVWKEEAFRLTTRRGYTLEATHDHPVLCCPPEKEEPQWTKLSELPEGWRAKVIQDGKERWDKIQLVESVGEKEIHSIATNTETYISNGIVSHNSGKSTCAAVQFASIATDTPITLADGTEIDQRMPWQKGRCLTMYVVGYQERHIGETIYRLLFKRGLFKVVHDPKTKELRAYDPDNDPELGLKPRESPPLIPARFVKKVSWNVRADNIFTKVIIQDPQTKDELAEIFAYSSQGIPKAGDPVDFIWIDEKIGMEGYIDEMKARLVDKEGQLTWSSWPDTQSDDLRKFIEVIDREIDAGNDDIARKTVLPMSSNKHLGRKAIKEFLAGCATAEEAAARDQGVFITDFLRMYPLFDKQFHSAIRSEDEDRLSKVLRTRDGIPPEDWTKTLVLDPGTSNPAVLLCAVPPPEFGDYLVAYQEIYPGRYDAKQLAKIVKKETNGQYFRNFLCDRRAGRQTAMGFGTRIVDAYEEAFLEAGLTCAVSKHRFQLASDDVGGRQMILQGLMHPTKSGLPKLRIVTHRCPSLCSQLAKVKKQVVKKEVKDERKAPGQPHDVCDCLEYFVASNPRYIPTPPTREQWPDSYRRYMSRIGTKEESPTPIRIGTHY